MKIIQSIIGNVILVFILVVSFSGIDSNAQSISIKEITKNKYALDNLIAGIKSDNCGIKRSSIYLAGKYRIKEVKDVLLDQLNNENEACTRILIALVLYEMGDSDGLLSVKDLIKTDEDEKVRRMATHIYYSYLKNDN
jgi:HEAT repeat protein